MEERDFRNKNLSIFSISGIQVLPRVTSSLITAIFTRKEIESSTSAKTTTLLSSFVLIGNNLKI